MTTCGRNQRSATGKPWVDRGTQGAAKFVARLRGERAIATCTFKLALLCVNQKCYKPITNGKPTIQGEVPSKYHTLLLSNLSYHLGWFIFNQI
jgi:hypothetical protein